MKTKRRNPRNPPSILSQLKRFITKVGNPMANLTKPCSSTKGRKSRRRKN